MAARSRSAGLALVIGTEYNDKDLRNLQRDLDKLKAKSKQAEGPFRKLGNSLKSNAGPALAAAGAAAGYMALQMGVDAVKAAADEQKQLANLEITLKNLGVAFNMKELDAFIQSMQFATGVSDDELRVAFTNLVRATKDVGQAQELLKLALDVSAGSGKSLTTVTTALSKAQAGNFSALKRLIPTIDATAVANKDLSGVVESLQTQFGGSAATAADTYAGQLAILTQVAGEVQQAFGAGFLQGFFDTTDVTKQTSAEMQKLMGNMEEFGQNIGKIAALLAELTMAYENTVGKIYDLWQWTNDTSQSTSVLEGAFKGLVRAILEKLMPALQLLGLAGLVTDMQNTGTATQTAATALDRYSTSWQNASRTVSYNPIVGTMSIVDPYGQALGMQPSRFATVIKGIIDAAKQAQADADQAGADAAAAAAEAARKLAERTKKETDRILGDLTAQLKQAKDASAEFRSIRQGYVADARADAAITTFAPEGAITGRGIAANIRQRLALVKRFADTITKLQGKLNGAALSDIIAQGPIAGLPYAEALLKDEKSLRQVNRLQGQLATPAGTIGRIGAELATGTTAAQLAAAETFTNKYVIGKDAIQITVNGEITAQTRRQLRQAVKDALTDVGREGKNGKKANVR